MIREVLSASLLCLLVARVAGVQHHGDTNDDHDEKSHQLNGPLNNWKKETRNFGNSNSRPIRFYPLPWIPLPTARPTAGTTAGTTTKPGDTCKPDKATCCKFQCKSTETCNVAGKPIAMACLDGPAETPGTAECKNVIGCAACKDTTDCAAATACSTTGGMKICPT